MYRRPFIWSPFFVTIEIKKVLFPISSVIVYTTLMKNVFVFGNPDLETDSLPVKMLPKLQEAFPYITFTILDPNEEWTVPKHMIIIDTVLGIKEITVFDDLHAFISAPRVTCHDFDAYMNLQFLLKLGKITSTRIIGIPAGQPEDRLEKGLHKALESVLKKEY